MCEMSSFEDWATRIQITKTWMLRSATFANDLKLLDKTLSALFGHPLCSELSNFLKKNFEQLGEILSYQVPICVFYFLILLGSKYVQHSVS